MTHATNPGTRAGRPQKLPYLVLHRVGFAKLPRSPGELVRSYRTVSPLPGTRPDSPVPGGILSVALSFASPRLHVMKHPALWCSDFPPDQSIDPAIVCVTPAVCYDLPSKLSSHSWGNFSSCCDAAAQCTFEAEYSDYIPGRRHL